jgi:hypothetical protein
MKDVGKFYGCLVCFVAISYIFWPFWYIFYRFGMLCHEKSGNPVPEAAAMSTALSRLSFGHKF